MKEIWLNISGYEDYYQVSNFGRVRSLDRIVNRKNTRNYLRKGKILNTNLSSSGYVVVGLTFNCKTINYYVHRLVAIEFIINDRDVKCVNHIDGIKINNKSCNLEWVTYSENSKHAYNTELNVSLKYNRKSGYGEDNPRSILTKEQVKEIKEKYIPYKYSAQKLAIEYKISRSCIEHIINNRSWTKY